MYPGKTEVVCNCPCSVHVDSETNMVDLCRQALENFALDTANSDDYRVSQLIMERGSECAQA